LVPERKAQILMYHRVAKLASDPWGLAVRPKHFAEQMEVLTRSCRVMPLSKLSEEINQGRYPERAIAVTFDDGYADNLIDAYPVLAANDIPATLFTTIGMIGSSHEFWWDQLERLIHLPQGSLPNCLNIQIGGRTYVWTDDGRVPRLPDSRWRMSNPPPTARHRLFQDLWHLLRPLPAVLQRQALDDISDWAGLEHTHRDSHRIMTAEEVRRIIEDGLVTVGGHTVNHPYLPDHAPSVQRTEIREGRQQLEAMIDRPVTLFAYPYGGFDVQTARIVADEGFLCACSTRPTAVERQPDPFNLPRVQVLDWDGETFSRHLREGFRRARS